MITIKVDPKAFNRDLEKNKQEVRLKSAKLIESYIKTTMGESYEEVPKATGALADSQYVEETTTGSSISFEFGYGGSNTQINPETGQSTDTYAIEVHEDLQMPHMNGKAKFLEDPARRLEASFGAMLSRDLR